MDKKKIISHLLTFGSIIGVLVIIGAGCANIDQPNPVIESVNQSLGALKQAKQLSMDEQAKANEQAESISNELTIALVQTEGAAVPAGATVAKDVIGCGDHIVFTKAPREVETDSVLHDALVTLFAVKDSNFQGLYNGLAFSDLSVDKIQSRDGVTTEVWLKGKVSSGGVCDDPRIKAQIESIIKRFKPNFKVYLNGTESAYRCIGDMSGKCK